MISFPDDLRVNLYFYINFILEMYLTNDKATMTYAQLRIYFI